MSMSYIVLIQFAGSVRVEVRGPYRSFKRADSDAKAWTAGGETASVEPVLPVAETPTDEQYMAALGPCDK